jgi:phosphoglycerate dehydrogenase-like enzyme
VLTSCRLHLPLNEETRHILNAHRLSLIQESAYVVNVARGELVDEAALLDALLEGRLPGLVSTYQSGALPADSRLLTTPNVVLTPHISGVIKGTARRRAELAAQDCDRIAQGLEALHRVV